MDEPLARQRSGASEKTVAGTLRHAAEELRLYSLLAWVIMPNHVHVVFKPLPINDADQHYHSLASIMQSLKGFTARACNRLLERTEEFWAHESYDHYIRDNDEWRRIVAYVLNNPVKAAYVKEWRDWKWNYLRNDFAN